MVRTVVATRYVTPLREGGSVPALFEADDDGLYVVKFRGAAQGPRALVAELIAGQIGRSLGLDVPELVLVHLDPALAATEPDPELQGPMERSGGLNLGMDFLPGALPFSPLVPPRPDPELAAEIVWLDLLITNPDRTARNPNLLSWHGRTWLIDHGAAIYVHHTWRDAQVRASLPFPMIADHVLLPFAGSIPEADARLAPRLDVARLAEIVRLVPDDWLPDDLGVGGPDDQRRAYIEYFERRLAEPRRWVEAVVDAVA